MTTDPPAGYEPASAIEMVEALGMRVAPWPAAGALAAAVVTIALAVAWWGLGALASSLVPSALLGVAAYWLWRWADERRGRAYWEPRAVLIEAVPHAAWVPSPSRPGALTQVVECGVDEDDRPFLRLSEGSLLTAEPRGDVVVAVVRPGPWRGLLDVPAPPCRPRAELSDDELRAAVRRSFDRLSAGVSAAIDSGPVFDRGLAVDLAEILDKGMESVRAFESLQARLVAGNP